jgi:hypothetical protein
VTNFETRKEARRRNTKERREFIEQWAEYVRTHDDEEWAAQQHEVIFSQTRIPYNPAWDIPSGVASGRIPVLHNRANRT